MKQLTINIPENKFQFVMELLSNLSFIKIEQPTGRFIITEEQKELVNEELRKIDEEPEYALDWDDVKHQLYFMRGKMVQNGFMQRRKVWILIINKAAFLRSQSQQITNALIYAAYSINID